MGNVDALKRPCDVEPGRFSELPNRLCKWALVAIVTAFAFSFADALRAQTPAPHPSFEVLTHRMDVDVDGAPNAYGPPGKPTLDVLMNAHYLERGDQTIVGYLVDARRKPILQGPRDPFPGYYISQTLMLLLLFWLRRNRHLRWAGQASSAIPKDESAL